MEKNVGFLNQYKGKIITAVVVMFVIVLMISTYEKWNDMWYNVGKNLYYLLHD